MANFIWREVFLELALRAIIQVHHKHNVWDIRQDRPSMKDFVNLNRGDGIFYAPEEHVRDAMALQIIETGLWKESEIEGEKRSYVIDTEHPVKMWHKDIVKFAKGDPELESFFSSQLDLKEGVNPDEVHKSVSVDVAFKRYQERNKNGEGDITIPCLIEAKRYQIKTIGLYGKQPNLESPQLGKINEDIRKLYAIWRFTNAIGHLEFWGKTFPSFYPYLLVWGKSPAEQPFDPYSLFNKKTITLAPFIVFEDCKYRTLPITWDEKYKVETYLWVTLLPLDFTR